MALANLNKLTAFSHGLRESKPENNRNQSKFKIIMKSRILAISYIFSQRNEK